uniref:ParB/Sulfiredoxin domain-containing protein n=1 Tax=Panagrolaimus sp. PS1159 TaxID=55785 RepID=A0AC35GYR8_9BILA
MIKNGVGVGEVFEHAVAEFGYEMLDKNKYIPIENLYCHPVVRPVDPEDVKKLVQLLKSDRNGTLAKFDQSKMMVSNSEVGTYNVEDGNHRTTAIKSFNDYAGLEGQQMIERLIFTLYRARLILLILSIALV